LKTFNLRNNFAPDPLESAVWPIGLIRPAAKDRGHYWNTLKTTRLVIENFYPLKAEMNLRQLFCLQAGIIDVVNVLLKLK